MNAFDPERLAERLGLLPPGSRTAPDPALARGDHLLDAFPRPAALREAAVLVPIVAHSDPTILLTRRTEHLTAHAGQVAFPGGRVEPDDPSPEAAALREAEEEVGLSAAQVRLLGRLDTYLTSTGFSVTPVVGLVAPPLLLHPDPSEVAETFEVPLAFFLQPDSRRLMSREFRGTLRHFYAYPFGDHFIWGATAGMLNNLVEILTAEPAA